jgi:pilus assembly protein FimV
VAQAAPAAARTAATPQRSQARLQIVPPTGPGKATATRTGTSTGGEGSMLQQQLRQKDEDIAAKAAEIGELKERVAELEKLRQDQQSLIAMKDSELAAAQQRLAEANKATATAATPASSPTATQAAADTSNAPASSPMPWIWGGAALVAIALLTWLFRRRGRATRSVNPRKSGFDSEALAASLRAPGADDEAPAPGVPAAAPVTQPADPAATVASEAPAWHAGKVGVEPPAPSAPSVQPRFVPILEPLPEPPVAKPSVDHRMKLARAFLDIGDDHSAKQLLREILDDVDPAAREEAARMLRELG